MIFNVLTCQINMFVKLTTYYYNSTENKGLKVWHKVIKDWLDS